MAWIGDLTYIGTGEGWLYLATVIDLGSRRLIGYSMADHMRTELVVDALAMEATTRSGVTTGIIFHSDRGAVPPRRLHHCHRCTRDDPVRGTHREAHPAGDSSAGWGQAMLQAERICITVIASWPVSASATASVHRA